MSRRRGEDGATVVEVLVAITIVTVGLLGAFRAFDAGAKGTYVSQRQQQAVALAQRELERIKSLPYAQIGLTSLPSHGGAETPSGDPFQDTPANPNFYVTSGSTPRYEIKREWNDKNSGTLPGTPDAGERLLTGGQVAPGPETVSGASGLTARVYRYVTDRQAPGIVGAPGLLPTQMLCPAAGNSKRIIVAVRLDDAANDAAPLRPVWVSAIVNQTPSGLVAPVVTTITSGSLICPGISATATVDAEIGAGG